MWSTARRWDPAGLYRSAAGTTGHAAALPVETLTAGAGPLMLDELCICRAGAVLSSLLPLYPQLPGCMAQAAHMEAVLEAAARNRLV
jgi:hypothetical protein